VDSIWSSVSTDTPLALAAIAASGTETPLAANVGFRERTQRNTEARYRTFPVTNIDHNNYQRGAGSGTLKKTFTPLHSLTVFQSTTGLTPLSYNKSANVEVSFLESIEWGCSLGLHEDYPHCRPADVICPAAFTRKRGRNRFFALILFQDRGVSPIVGFD